MSFPCTRCGLCCKAIHKVAELSDYHDGDGICRYYSERAGCVIYETRPLVCRIDEGYELFFRDRISHSEYYAKNAECCNALQEKAEMDKRYRVTV